MNDSSVPKTLANVAVGGTWVTWFVSHIADINVFLQFIALVAAITASCLASRYYVRNTKR